MSPRLTRLLPWLALAFAAVVVAGCASPTPGSPATPPGSSGLPAASGAARLAGVCPATVVIQAAWEPDASQGAEYQLLGPGYQVDSERKRISGPLVAAGKDTGVRVEIRAGGAAVGFTPVPAQMYLDRAITLGNVNTDLAVATSANFPVTTVVAPETKSPQILMWDPATHPTWHTIHDIGTSTAKVVVAKDSNFAAQLVATGLIRQDQIDASYTGAPARFVTDPTIAQQGFATEEPYLYQHEIQAWNKPVAYQLLADVGYASYPEAPSVRTGDVPQLAGCLTRLIPLIQQAQIDYLNDPGPTNHLIVDTVTRYNDGWTYSLDVANYAAGAMRQLGIVANDTTGPLGGVDPSRVQSTINTFAPLLTGAGAHVRPGLHPTDIATNQFINPTITLR